ncbi:MAG TPA: hypothetical protein PLY87_24780, partial [Planctomycetaceae bacterium]|nr:hypothetical protein [Planctomycetaceae bacterium]
MSIIPTTANRRNDARRRLTNVLCALALSWLLSASCLRAETLEIESPGNNANSFLIPAYAFDRGNARTFTSSWADAEPMVAFGGESPIVIEYDIDFPVTAEYALSINYAAADARPVQLFLDGKNAGTCCRSATGSWNTSGAQWESMTTLTIAQGKHTLKLQREGAFPHVVSLKFASSVALPEGWKQLRPNARALDSPPPVPAYVRYTADKVDTAALRRAIVDLMETFGAAYPRGGEYLKQLDGFESQAASSVGTTADVSQQRTTALAALRRRALLIDNPVVDFDKLLLIKRAANAPSLGLPRNWQSNSSLPHTGYDDEIATHSLAEEDGELLTLFKPADGRFVGDLDLHFDANRMLFSMPGDKGRWQVFEIGADGSGLRQLTGEQPDVDSYDACYLPSGQIVFTSTACFAGVPCVYG